jgi:hypothetical protein
MFMCDNGDTGALCEHRSLKMFLFINHRPYYGKNKSCTKCTTMIFIVHGNNLMPQIQYNILEKLNLFKVSVHILQVHLWRKTAQILHLYLLGCKL